MKINAGRADLSAAATTAAMSRRCWCRARMPLDQQQPATMSSAVARAAARRTARVREGMRTATSALAVAVVVLDRRSRGRGGDAASERPTLHGECRSNTLFTYFLLPIQHALHLLSYFCWKPNLPPGSRPNREGLKVLAHGERPPDTLQFNIEQPIGARRALHELGFLKLLGHGASHPAQTSHADAKNASASKLPVTGDDICHCQHLRGGARWLEAHSMRRPRQRHGKALLAACTHVWDITWVVGIHGRAHT